MHPMMYAFIDRRARRLVPRSGATDTQLQAVFDAVFGNDVNAQGVVPEHADSKDSASTRAWLDTHRNDPAVAFFLKRNPQYDQGYALPVVMGLDGADFLYTVGQFARIAMRKAVT